MYVRKYGKILGMLEREAESNSVANLSHICEPKKRKEKKTKKVFAETFLRVDFFSQRKYCGEWKKKGEKTETKVEGWNITMVIARRAGAGG